MLQHRPQRKAKVFKYSVHTCSPLASSNGVSLSIHLPKAYSFVLSVRLCTKSHDNALLCATSVFSVSLWVVKSEQKKTTETQRTQRLHREFSGQELLVQSLAKQLCQTTPTVTSWIRPAFQRSSRSSRVFSHERRASCQTRIRKIQLAASFSRPPEALPLQL